MSVKDSTEPLVHVMTAVLGINALSHGVSALSWVFYPEKFLQRYSYMGETTGKLIEAAEPYVPDTPVARDFAGWRVSLDLLRFIGATHVGLGFLSGWNLYKWLKTGKLSEGSIWTTAVVRTWPSTLTGLRGSVD